MTTEELKRFRRAYTTQRRDAIKKRGIAWEFESFEQWLEWWGEDIYRRGPYRGQLVMARYGDQGPYHPDNVRKITSDENVREGQLGHIDSLETRLKRSQSLRGRIIPEEVKNKISQSCQGRRPTNQRRVQTPYGQFVSLSKAAEAEGVNVTTICRRCQRAISGYRYLFDIHT